MSFTWKYKDQLGDIDYDKIWETAKNAALMDWAGDVRLGAYKSSTQYSAQSAQKSVLEAVPEILSVKMNLPNLIYIDFDSTRFPKHLVLENGNRNIMTPSFPSALVSCEMVRK
jgi:urate oxidase